MTKTTKSKIRNIIVVSDTHCGCRFGLCPPGGFPLDGGGTYELSPLQTKLWARWLEFQTKWVPQVTRGEPFILVHNGDALEGVHHEATTQVSYNLADQENIGHASLKSLCERAAAYYHVRGTQSHVGPGHAEEERLAQRLGAKRDSDGHYSRMQLWINLQGHLINFDHHIGTTGSSAYESTAVGKEMVENYVESGRWGYQPAQVIVRSHRHRYYKTEQYGDKGLHISTVTPGWQLKTPYVYRLAGGRLAPPQIGGVLIRAGDEELHTRAMVWSMGRPQVEHYG